MLNHIENSKYYCKKLSSLQSLFTKPFYKDDIRHLAGLKQQISQKILFRSTVSLRRCAAQVISSFVIFAVLDLRDGGCRP